MLVVVRSAWVAAAMRMCDGTRLCSSLCLERLRIGECQVYAAVGPKANETGGPTKAGEGRGRFRRFSGSKERTRPLMNPSTAGRLKERPRIHEQSRAESLFLGFFFFFWTSPEESLLVLSRLTSPPPPPSSPLRRLRVMAANGNPAAASSLAATVPVEAVLFDIDGTLCDSDPLHHAAFQELLLAIGYNNGVPIDDEFFIKNIAGRSDVEAAQNLFPDWELEKGLKFLEDKEAKYRSLAKERLVPVKGLEKVVQWVKDHGYKRAAVTNAPRINAELMISLLGLSDFFQAVIVGGECEKPKPAPYPYLKALKELQVSAEHTFIFEDSASGISAGVAAGMPVVAVATRNPENSLLEAGASLIIKDYEDPKLWAALEEIDREEAKLKKDGA